MNRYMMEGVGLTILGGHTMGIFRYVLTVFATVSTCTGRVVSSHSAFAGRGHYFRFGLFTKR